MDWFNRYSKLLFDLKGIRIDLDKSKQCSDTFVFANGSRCSPDFVVDIPVCIGSKCIPVEVAIFDLARFHNPLLVSLPDIQKFRLCIDTSQNTVSSDFCNLLNYPLAKNSSGLYCIPVLFRTENFVNVVNLSPRDAILKFHRQRGHLKPDKLIKYLSAAGEKFDDDLIYDVVRNCPDCKFKQLRPVKPKTGGLIVSALHDVCFCDLVELSYPNRTNSVLVCHFLDAFTKYSFAEVVQNKEASSTLAVFAKYGALLGAYPKLLLTDNGTEFCNQLWDQFCEFQDVVKKTTVSYYPQGNSVCERRHGFIKGICEYVAIEMAKIGTAKPDIILAETIRVINATPSTTTGYSPSFMVTFVQPKLGLYDDNDSLSQLNDPEKYNKDIQYRIAVRKEVLAAAFGKVCRDQFLRTKRSKAMFNFKEHNLGDIVYRFQDKAYRGPYPIIGRDGKLYLLRQGNKAIWANAHELTDRFRNDDVQVVNSVVSNPIDINSDVILSFHIENGHCSPEYLQRLLFDVHHASVSLYQISEVLQACTVCNSNPFLLEFVSSPDLKECPVCKNKFPIKDYVSHRLDSCDPPTYKCTDCDLTVDESCMDIHNDLFCTHDVNAVKAVRFPTDVSICPHCESLYDDSQECYSLTTHSSISSSDYDRYSTEINAARRKELDSWIKNGVFSIVKPTDIPSDANIVTTRCVETLKQSGSTVRFKVRIVARGFQDAQKDALCVECPAVSKLSLRMFMQFTVDNDFVLKTLDIKTAFLQGKRFNREEGRSVYLKPPREILQLLNRENSDELWLALSPVYGLVDAPHRWYLTLSEVLLDLGLYRSKYDHAVFLYYVGDKVIGMICVYVDDLLYSGNPQFESDIIEKIMIRFEIGSSEKSNFTYCGIAVSTADHVLTLSQTAYIESLQPVCISGQKDHSKPLNTKEYAEFRKLLGHLSWLAVSTRPDIAFPVNQLSRVQNEPTIADAISLNKILRGLGFRKSLSLRYSKLPQKELIVLADASYGSPSTQGSLILFASSSDDSTSTYQASLVDWTSKKIYRVARSTTTAECLSVCNSIDTAIYIAFMWHEISGEWLSIKVFNDSKNFVNLCYSNRMPDEKRLSIELDYVRESLATGFIAQISHLSTHKLLADALTKPQTPTFAKLIDFLSTGKLYL